MSANRPAAEFLSSVAGQRPPVFQMRHREAIRDGNTGEVGE